MRLGSEIIILFYTKLGNDYGLDLRRSGGKSGGKRLEGEFVR